MKFTVQKPEQLEAVAEQFLSDHEHPQVVLFIGEMGVGKTTFITQICRQLGVEAEGSSPTFSLVNEYPLDDGSGLIYHFDCYRLNEPEEALDFGVEEYFDSGNWCFVEWPEKLDPYLPADAIQVEMTMDSGIRTISW